MNSIRELIIQEFSTRALVIRNDGNPQAYSTDIGLQAPLRCRPSLALTETPRMVLWPQPETSVNKYGKSLHVLTMKVEAICECKDENLKSVTGEQMLADMIQCFSNSEWNTSYIDALVYTGGGVNVPVDGDVTVSAYAEFLIQYFTVIGDAYRQD